MSNKKATKRALLTSILAICLCLVMLIGSTFAWFTDTASTAVNQIQSGTLKVDIVNEAGDSIKDKSMNFVNKDNSSDILWEPGVTFKTPVFQVKNIGNLALKYKLTINGVTGDSKLLEVIKFSVVKEDGTALDLAAFEGHLETANATGEKLYIQGHMEETAGNDYQNKKLEGLGITVLATQDTVENDSFNNTYDENATYPVDLTNAIAVTTAEAAAEAIKDAPAGSTILLKAGTYEKITLDKIDGLWHAENGNEGTQYPNSLNYGGPAGDQYTPNEGIYHKTLANNLTIVGEAGVTVNGIEIYSDSTLSGTGYGGIDTTKATADVLCVAKNLSFVNITFTDDFSNKGSYIDGLTIRDCTFADGACINTNQNDKNKISGLGNVSIVNNRFIGSDSDEAVKETRIALSYVTNVTIKGNKIECSEYNAIQLGASVSGTIDILNNIIQNTGDRAFRISGVNENTAIAISNNTISNAARVKDGKYQVICIGDNNGVPASSSIKFTSNTYDGVAWAENIVIQGTTDETIIFSDNTRSDT